MADTTTVLLLVRHGLTPTTGKVLPGRAPGLSLSDAGRAQAVQAAQRLAELPRIDALYSSPMERAVETAEPTVALTGLDLTTEPGLLECDFGEWTGQPLADLMKLPEWATVQQAPSSFRFPGGESFVEMQSRITETLQRIRNAHLGQVVVCFSHADPIKAALAQAIGMPLDLFQRLDVSPASVSMLAYRPHGAASAVTINSTGRSLAEFMH